MSEIVVRLENEIITVEQKRVRQTSSDCCQIDISSLEKNKKYGLDMFIKNTKYANCILFQTPYQGTLPKEEDAVGPNAYHIVVWSNSKNVRYGLVKLSHVYEELIKFRYKVYRIGLSRNYFSLWMTTFLTPLAKNLDISDVKLSVDPYNTLDGNVLITAKNPGRRQKLSAKYIHCYRFPLRGLFREETRITNAVKMILTVNGQRLIYNIEMKTKKHTPPKLYYTPMKTVYSNGYAVYIRRNARGELAIVKRPMEPEEKRIGFRIIESGPVSCLLYHIGKYFAKHAKKKVNLFYEKFAQKAEEGTFELFLQAKQSPGSRSYYIMDKNAPDYQRIKDVPGVVKKYSWKYYWLMYRVNAFIATETPVHLHLLRGNNRYIKRASFERTFVFLQHGVTYLKRQGPTSVFLAGKEGEPTLMIVGSEKERDVCADMLRLPENRFLNVGLPIFGTIEYNHIDQNSPDKVVVLLTWKRNDEMLVNFADSAYYRNVLEIRSALMKRTGEENICIVPHPKVVEKCRGTGLEKLMWKGSVAEALKSAKLLITDYSSACYNCFYQGAGVVFYQPDLEQYEKEVGKLIPTEDEYIGARAFSLQELEIILDDIFENGSILLEKCRNESYEQRYESINEFHDGRNIERICEELRKRKII